MEKMKKYKNWKSYAQFSAFAKNVADVELLSKIKIVEKFGHRMPAIIDKVKSVCMKDTRQADIVLSTIHKAKGLEFDTVVLLNDFADLREMYGPGQMWPEDEKNLLYVAITRAKTNFVMNTLVREEILERNGLLKIVTFKIGESAQLQCAGDDCDEDLSDSLTPGQIMVRRESSNLSSGVYFGGVGLGGLNSVMKQSSALFCKTCSCRLMPSFRNFIDLPQDDKKRGMKRKR